MRNYRAIRDSIKSVGGGGCLCLQQSDSCSSAQVSRNRPFAATQFKVGEPVEYLTVERKRSQVDLRANSSPWLCVLWARIEFVFRRRQQQSHLCCFRHCGNDHSFAAKEPPLAARLGRDRCALGAMNHQASLLAPSLSFSWFRIITPVVGSPKWPLLSLWAHNDWA